MAEYRAQADLRQTRLQSRSGAVARQDFLMFVRTIDLPTAQAEAVISDLAMRLGDAARGVALPERRGGEAAKAAEDALRGIIAESVEALR